MTPQPLAFLSNRIGLNSVAFDVRRNEEVSGAGDGRIWTAQLARPLWTVMVTMHEVDLATSREIDARIRSLNGSMKPFLFADPSYRGPRQDPGGVVLGSATVTVSAIGTTRETVSLSGLPNGYKIVAGDRLSISHGTDKVYLGEVSEDRTAGASVLTNLPLFPYLPMSIATGAEVELKRPVVKVIVPPGGHVPFVTRPGFYAQGSTLQMMQKL